MRSRSLPLASAALAAALLAAPGTAAFAHSDLVSSTPEDGARVATLPATVQLVFNEPIDPSFVQVVVADEADVAHPVKATADGPRVDVPVPQELTPGRTEVRYRVVSADGHPVTGRVGFTVGAHSASPTPRATPPQPAPPTDPGATTGEASLTSTYVLTGVAASVVAVVAVLIALVSRRHRR